MILDKYRNKNYRNGIKFQIHQNHKELIFKKKKKMIACIEDLSIVSFYRQNLFFLKLFNFFPLFNIR